MNKDLQIVGFKVGRETFGIPISLVREIVRMPEITAVPDAPDCVQGVMNLRGKIISVIDMRRRFGEKDVQPSSKNRVVVAEAEGKLVGLIVDAASEVLKLSPSQIEAAPGMFQEEGLSYVTGLGKVQGRLIILIDLPKVLQRGELRRVTAEPQAEAPPGAMV